MGLCLLDGARLSSPHKKPSMAFGFCAYSFVSFLGAQNSYIYNFILLVLYGSLDRFLLFNNRKKTKKKKVKAVKIIKNTNHSKYFSLYITSQSNSKNYGLSFFFFFSVYQIQKRAFDLKKDSGTRCQTGQTFNVHACLDINSV